MRATLTPYCSRCQVTTTVIAQLGCKKRARLAENLRKRSCTSFHGQFPPIPHTERPRGALLLALLLTLLTYAPHVV